MEKKFTYSTFDGCYKFINIIETSLLYYMYSTCILGQLRVPPSNKYCITIDSKFIKFIQKANYIVLTLPVLKNGINRLVK